MQTKDFCNAEVAVQAAQFDIVQMMVAFTVNPLCQDSCRVT